MKCKLFLAIMLQAVIFFFACDNMASKDIIFDGKYPRITTISYSENGENYKVPAVAGHCIVFFKETVSQSDAIGIIKSGGGKIIEQIPAFNYYLVKVKEGKEGVFVTYLKSKSEVQYAYFNVLNQLLSEVFIMDDFVDVEPKMLTTHGNGVRKIFSKYSISDDVHSRNMVFLNDKDSSWKEHTTASNVILSELLGAVKTSSNKDLTLFNMSFGPPLPGQKSKYDDYDDIDSANQKLYIRLHVNSLEYLAVCFGKMKSKGISNFIVTKSSGNESMHGMESVFEQLKEETINILKDNFVLVCAYDTKSNKLYSNFPRKKHPIMTTVDVSQEPWMGTSFAAPKLMGFIDKVHGKYELLSAGQLLQAIRNATPVNPQEPMTYEMFERAAKKLMEGGSQGQKYCFRLELTSNYDGEWDLSNGEGNEVVKYEVHNTFDHDYLNGTINALYLENNTSKNLNIYLNPIDSDQNILPMFYTLPAGEKDGFFAYQMYTMERISVRNLEIQLSTW